MINFTELVEFLVRNPIGVIVEDEKDSSTTFVICRG